MVKVENLIDIYTEWQRLTESLSALCPNNGSVGLIFDLCGRVARKQGKTDAECVESVIDRLAKGHPLDEVLGWLQVIGGVAPRVIIMDVKIIVPNKVIEVTFADGTKEKAVCREPDVFSLETAIAICISKKIMGGSSAYNNAVKRGVKVYEDKLRKEAADKAEQERIAKRREKRLAYKERRAAKREQAEKEKQIEIQKEAYIRAMKYMRTVDSL